MITILLIDDDMPYATSLCNNAKLRGDLELIHYQNYEAGFKELRTNPSINGLIFDAKCWITQQEQDEEVEPSEQGLSEGLRLLQEYETITQNYLPMIVSTGKDFAAKHFLPQLTALQAKIFQKEKTNPGELFNELILRIEAIENYKIERQYADVFAVFAKNYLSNDVKLNLLSILNTMQRADIGEIRKNLALIRTINETTMQELLNKKGYFKQPDLISEFSGLIRRVCNNYGSHKPRNNDILPSKYAVITLTNALLEIILWFGKEMDSK
jgi:hypothetical protein